MRALRSTPLRLAVALIAVFAVFLAAGLGTAYVLMHRTLSAEIDGRALQVVAELRAIGRPEERLERVQEIAATSRPDTLLIRLETGGDSIGNLPESLDAASLRDGGLLSGHALPLAHPADSYRILLATLPEGRVAVLVGRRALSELNEIFLAILGFSFLPALAITSGLAIVVVRRTGRRVEAIRGTLQALSAGRLTARVGGTPPDTDLGDIARDLDRMASAQEAATEALRQIGSDIAHDLKTPIQRVAVHLERVGAEALPVPARTSLDAAQAETAGIIGTFQSLLQIAQLEGGQGRHGFAPVDLGALVRDMAEIYAPAVEEAGARLDCSVTAPRPVAGDRHLLARLIANLVENALRHAPGTPIRLALEGRVLSVSDGGPGIPEARREDVLRRLVRLEASRSTPGSGLGLALVKAIADQHGAALGLEDAEGGGLRVRLVFPAGGEQPEV
ncbi:HAMP domain-containing histidine kinase [Pseudooceanicola sp. CBS1P-1]|uniref:sensor histidine kinase n=1 Tax=Pseudooceanicola endophyticus TaxID=2841273 RepID=UPI001C01DF1D|nr:HAMP domain-containing sensor histidine kinase [Pseudooceanicola endophyticus]MBT9385226.1 HAMP domain-containing histidine kinase [Pseudooceanicola endophyticus]